MQLTTHASAPNALALALATALLARASTPAAAIAQQPIIAQPAIPIPTNLLRQGGFELPELGAGLSAYAYNPPSAVWTFAGATGIAANSSAFTHQNPPAPQGDQVAFIQGGPGSVATQTFNAPAGRYRLSLRAAQRIQGAVTNQQTIILRVNNLQIAKLSPSDGNYASITTQTFVLPAGTHTLQLIGENPLGGDNTVFVDDLRLHSLPSIAARWSSAATWGGTIPGPNDSITIPAGIIVLLDTTAGAKNITVDGELHCADQNLTLDTEWMMIHGRLECGSEVSPYLDKFALTLLGQKDSDNIMNMGDKFLAAMNAGVIELHGEPRTSWTQLAQSAAIGDTMLHLASAADWRLGDQLVIAPTLDASSEGEVVTVTGVDPTKTIFNFTPPLQYAHFGETSTYHNTNSTWILDERAEVGLLTRNLLIQGDAGSDATGFGGHTMSMFGTTVHVSGVEFYRVGQKFALGRYPFHWHLVKNAPGQYVTNSSVHRSYNRCITVHGTHDTLVADNVCYDFIGHGYFLEDGIEQNNIFDHNLGIWAKKPPIAEALLETDYRSSESSNGPAVFWIAHPDNIYTNNAAAGSEGTGFWYGMVDQVTGAAASWPESQGVNPRRAPFGVFDTNRVHSSRQGFSSCTEAGGPLGMEPPNEAWINKLTATNNQQGVWPCAPPMTKQNARFTELIVANAQNGMQAPNPMTFEDSLFVSYTANAPKGAQLDGGIDWRAIQNYDQGYLLDNVHFVNYDRPQMTIFFPGAGAHKLANNRGLGLTFENSPNLFLDPHNFSVPGAGPAFWGDVLHDLDGSFAGANFAVAPDHPLMFDGTCKQPTNLNISGYACPYRYAHFRTENFAQIAPVTVLRSDGFHNSSGHIEQRFITEFMIDGPYQYSWRYDSGMIHRRVLVELYNAFPGDTPVYELLDVPATVAVQTGWSAAPNLAALLSGPGRRYFYRDHSLFLKMSADTSMPNWHATDQVTLCMSGGYPCAIGALTPSPPSVSITAPADGARVPLGANIAVNAVAAGNNGKTITGARLYLGTSLISTIAGAGPFAFSLAGIPAGSYALKLVVEDNQGQSFTALQQLFVGDLAPRVELTAPAKNTTVVGAAPVNVTYASFNWPVVPGGRHLHYFVNGVDRGELFNAAGSFAVTGLKQGKQELRVALAEADHTIRAINDQVLVYVAQNGVLADFEDGPDTRGSLVPSDANMGPLSEILFAWGTPIGPASRADAEDDINYFTVGNNGAPLSSASYRLSLSPPQNWVGLYTQLRVTQDGMPKEVFIVDAIDGPTSIGFAALPDAVLPLPTNPRKIDQVIAIELRYPESSIPPMGSVLTHLRNLKLQ